MVLVLLGCSSPEAVPIHPEFSITAEQLDELTAGLPESAAAVIKANPTGFLERIKDLLPISEELFILADKQHDIGEEYVPDDLVNLDDFDLVVNRRDLNLREIVMPDVLAMNASAEMDGVTLVYSSAYRSYSYQKQVYERNVRQLGQEQADRESARPGTSQHQLGTTIDFGSITDEFAFTDAGKWLVENAWKFGFSLSYPEGYEELTGYRHEIWHYRYISRPAAVLERRFFDSIQYNLLTFLNAHLDTLRSAYKQTGKEK